jgi:flavin reductase (DIM6/NTAB) family NADH-FMN oxidoreductase RutF
MPVEPDAFRAALGRFPSGVTVVTLDDGDGGVHGITVSSFVSLSLVPPLVGVAIGRKARAHRMIGAPRFGVSVLAADQANVSDHFAARPVALPADAFVDLAGHRVIRGAVAHLVCAVVERVDTGDHTLLVGRVEASRVAEGASLAYQGGRYGRVLVDGPSA